MGTRYEVEGLDSVLAALDAIGGEEIEERLKEARLASADMVADRARATVPNRTGRGTGQAATSIRTITSRMCGIVLAGGTAAPYVPAIHWGWNRQPWGHVKRHRGGPIAPNPWIAQAAVDLEPAWTAEFEATVRALCDEYSAG
ncbi:hypothetical protein [Catenulispora rubra]|uniref:hypothetical protein n=1 Tax=Catenulispora rubra TaxID=280293 RepID=UPI001892078E|nr:hypothetical protein [Catenulispora rubra]